MSAETALRALLVADAPTAALVSTRVTADRIEQGAARPFVVFTRTASEPIQLLDGTVLKTRASLEVQCWADTRVSAEAVADAVTTAVRGVTSQAVSNRSGAYDADLDLECSILNVEWWE
jgi:Protein of unknown function (DUF3168)